MAAATSHDQDAYEEQNVHEVYQQIAGHFSLTRHKVRFGSYYYHHGYITSIN